MNEAEKVPALGRYLYASREHRHAIIQRRNQAVSESAKTDVK